MPASRPVQAWFGQFIHGVLEESYRQFDAARQQGQADQPPWPSERIAKVCQLIKDRLEAAGLSPWSRELERLGNERAEAAINGLAPDLFPLIHRAEVRLTGARPLPISKIPSKYRFRVADRYEMQGVIDVITHVELSDPVLQDNRLLKLIVANLPENPPEQFELIVDYKGQRRPPHSERSAVGAKYWDIYGWQVQTYAHLRSTHEDSLPVVAGVLIYLNELLPRQDDLIHLRQEIRKGTTDIVPEPGSETERLIQEWTDETRVPDLPIEWRLKRSVRVEPVSPASIETAVQAFDDVVARIEICRGKELEHGKVVRSWIKNAKDPDTCKACDVRTYCPAYGAENSPKLPAVQMRT